MTDRDKRNARALYMHEPEEMLVTAVGVALHVACGLVAERQARTLITFAGDHVLCKRAGRLIVNYLLRNMLDRTEPTAKQFNALVRDVAAVAKES